jgi:hypothetical protein
MSERKSSTNKVGLIGTGMLGAQRVRRRCPARADCVGAHH